MKQLIEPMKAHIGSTDDLTRTALIFEPKLDGIRALCYVNKDLQFFSRNMRNITSEYPEFKFRKALKARSAILDGEIVVLDKTFSPRFSLWQQGYQAVYIVYDILMINGKSLLTTPLIDRKKVLEGVVEDTSSVEKCIFTHNGKALWKEMLKRSMEGVMAKEITSLYYPGKRSSVWLKIKAYKTLEAIIIGYSPGNRIIASLALGIYDEQGTLNYIGKVGTGFSESFLTTLHKKLQEIETKSSSAVTTLKDIIPVKPLMVCEVKYLEFTNARILRTAVFLRIRPDKNPQEITFKDQELTV